MREGVDGSCSGLAGANVHQLQSRTAVAILVPHRSPVVLCRRGKMTTWAPPPAAPPFVRW